MGLGRRLERGIWTERSRRDAGKSFASSGVDCRGINN